MLRQVARGDGASVRAAQNYVVTPEEFKLLKIASIALRAVCDESLAHLGTSPFRCAGRRAEKRVVVGKIENSTV